jgi:hypothetical protein
MEQTPEQRAIERFPMPSEEASGFDWYDDACDKAHRRRFGFKACIEELVLPLEAYRSSDLSTIKELREYATHREDCELVQYAGCGTGNPDNIVARPCTCGLSELLTRLK